MASLANTIVIPGKTADEEFHTSSIHPFPAGYTPWQIRVDYPQPQSVSVQTQPPIDAPWLNISLHNPEFYMAVMREYCFEGMTNNDFIPQKNTVRQWYHACWMHPGKAGREPLHGLTSERYTPPREFSASQQRTTQTWAVGFYNSAGASVFGGVWANTSKPNWTENLHFPPGTAVFKLLYTNACDSEIPFLEGSPAIEAMIAVQPDDPKKAPDPSIRLSVEDGPAEVRLLQMDIAVRDDRAVTGWVWGTYMYNNNNGTVTGYDGMIPVGLSWGNDPEVTQEAYDRGARPRNVWINPVANDLRLSLHGGRPSWGWNGRLNGPADNFISACQSCHSTAQWNPYTMSVPSVSMVPPAPVHNASGRFVPVNDSITMDWFQDINCGTPITQKDAISADYSLQMMIGYENFVAWAASQPHIPDFPRKPGVPAGPLPPPTEKDPHRRQGPDMGF